MRYSERNQNLIAVLLCLKPRSCQTASASASEVAGDTRVPWTILATSTLQPITQQEFSYASQMDETLSIVVDLIVYGSPKPIPETPEHRQF